MSATSRTGGFTVGNRSSFAVMIDDRMLRKFVELTGDDNPVHVDADYARKTALGKPVVHGMLTASFVSTLIGKHLPGPGALWISQEFNFRRPVHVGETLRFSAEVIDVNDSLGLLTVKVEVTNDTGTVVVDGKGRVKLVAETVAEQPTRTGPRKGTAIVTGANGAVGAACARRLSRTGHPVILACHGARSVADAVADEILAGGGLARVVVAELADEDQVTRLVEVSRGLGHGISTIVHAAAMPINPRPLLESRWKDIDGHIQVAARVLLQMVQAATPDMDALGGGSIVAIGTQASEEMPIPGWGGYLTSKAAMQMLVQCLASELGPRNIRVNMVAPGLMQTAFTTDMPERARLMAAQQTPLRRLCTPDDVAEAVEWLCDAAAMATGQIIRLNGGRLMR